MPTDPMPTVPLPTVPEWPQFLEGRVNYRCSLGEQVPDALRTAEEDKAPPKVLPRTRRPVDLEPPEPRFAAAGAC